MEHAVTAFLRSVKELLSVLESWSAGGATALSILEDHAQLSSHLDDVVTIFIQEGINAR